jgi:hypothetical protein
MLLNFNKFDMCSGKHIFDIYLLPTAKLGNVEMVIQLYVYVLEHRLPFM